MTGQREAMVAWDPWLVWDRVHGKAKQSMGKHGTAWHGVAWELGMGMGMAAQQQPTTWPGRTTQPGGLETRETGRGGGRERARKSKSASRPIRN